MCVITSIQWLNALNLFSQANLDLAWHLLEDFSLKSRAVTKLAEKVSPVIKISLRLSLPGSSLFVSHMLYPTWVDHPLSSATSGRACSYVDSDTGLNDFSINLAPERSAFT